MSLRTALAAAAVGLGLALSPTAQAAGLTGDTVTVAWDAYVLGNIYSGPNTVVVGSGVEVTNLGQIGAANPTFNIDFTATGVVITDIRTGGPFAQVNDPNAFNGIVISDIFDTTGSHNVVTSVSVASANWGPGTFDNRRVWSDSNHVYVNFMGLDSTNGQSITLNINTAVPEPASLALLGTGLAGLAAAARRRRANR